MPSKPCKSIGCSSTVAAGVDFCESCLNNSVSEQDLAKRYPDHYRSTGDHAEVDTFAVNQMFGINDPSGCMQFAIHKLLLSGGRREAHADVRQARDVLTRWLQLNEH